MFQHIISKEPRERARGAARLNDARDSAGDRVVGDGAVGDSCEGAGRAFGVGSREPRDLFEPRDAVGVAKPNSLETPVRVDGYLRG